MCGRYTLTSPEDIAARFGLGALSETGSDIRPRFNVSPSQSVPVIRTHDGETALELMCWGFQPCLCRACSSIQIAPDFIGPPALPLAALPPALHTGTRLITRQTPTLPPGSALFVISSLHYS